MRKKKEKSEIPTQATQNPYLPTPFPLHFLKIPSNPHPPKKTIIDDRQKPAKEKNKEESG